MSLLEVAGLSVSIPTADGTISPVRDVSFEVASHRTLGLVGESGAGKSVLGLTLLGLMPSAHVSGSATFKGASLCDMPAETRRRIRGAEIAMVFQDPASALHPMYRVGWQLREVIRAHETMSAADARRRGVDLLRAVNIPDPERSIDTYPHQLSGGMRQRVMIAMALALEPDLLIADEPTTELDATIQAQVIELIRSIQEARGMGLIIITHDLGVVAYLADDVAVMYAASLVERGSCRVVFAQPHHPYTCGLLRAMPASALARGAPQRFTPIEGQPPSLVNPPSGCRFHPRCPYAMERCITETPVLQPLPDDTTHRSACWLPGAITGSDPAAHRARQEFAAAHQSDLTRALPGVAGTEHA